MEFILVLFFIIVGGFTLIGKLLGISFTPKNGSHFVDKSTHIHHHYHDNRSINIDGEKFKNLKN